MLLHHQGSWDIALVENTAGIWVQVFNFYPQGQLSAFARMRAFLQSVELTEKFCLVNHYQGWLAKVVNPSLCAHMRAIGATNYQLDEDGVWFYKLVLQPVKYNVRLHVKRIIQEAKCLNS